MNEDKIAGLRELAGKANLPWEIIDYTFNLHKVDYDANHIADNYVFAAANAIPDLLDALEEAKRETEEWKNVLDELQGEGIPDLLADRDAIIEGLSRIVEQMMASHAKQLEEAQAENDRLREALEYFDAYECVGCGEWYQKPVGCVVEIMGHKQYFCPECSEE